MLNSNGIVPGVAISTVDIMPIRAYANAQNGKASGSLHVKHFSQERDKSVPCRVIIGSLRAQAASDSVQHVWDACCVKNLNKQSVRWLESCATGMQ